MNDSLLSPSIDSIEADLFSPPITLINRWINGDISDDEEKLLSANPLAIQLKENLQNDVDANVPDLDLDKSPQMPTYLENLIVRHLNAKKSFEAIEEFKSGQVRLITSLPNKDNNLPDKKLAVLLIEPIQTGGGGTWRGAMTSSETAWASYWDMLLEADVDEPFDPIVGMIQVWNPINIKEKNLGDVLAELSPTRVAAVRALKEEYLFGDDLDEKEASPGQVYGRKTLDGLSVLTGSPLAKDDLRHRYQLLYHTVAKVVSVPLAIEVEETVKSSILERMIENLQTIASEVGNSLVPQPMVANAMGDSSTDLETKTFLYNDCLELRIILDDELIFIQARMVKTGSCLLLLKDADVTLKEIKVDSEFSPIIDIDPDEHISLLIQCEEYKNIEINFPLTS